MSDSDDDMPLSFARSGHAAAAPAAAAKPAHPAPAAAVAPAPKPAAAAPQAAPKPAPAEVKVDPSPVPKPEPAKPAAKREASNSDSEDDLPIGQRLGACCVFAVLQVLRQFGSARQQAGRKL